MGETALSGRLRKGAELDVLVSHLPCYHGKIPKRQHWKIRGMYSLDSRVQCTSLDRTWCVCRDFIYLFLLHRGQEVENEENTGTNPDLQGLTSVTFVLQLGPTSWKFLEPPKIMATAGDHTFNTWACVVIFKQAVTFHRASNRTQQITCFLLPFLFFPSHTPSSLPPFPLIQFHCWAQAGLMILLDSPLSASGALGLELRTIISAWQIFLEFHPFSKNRMHKSV